MSLPYSEFPVYVGQPNSDSVTNEKSNFLAATDVNVSYAASMTPKRSVVGIGVADPDPNKSIDQSNAFTFGGPLTANISFGLFLNNSVGVGEDGYSFLTGSNQDKYFPIQVGSGKFERCYLDSFSVDVQPYQPVSLQVNFTSLRPETGVAISGDSTPYNDEHPPFDSDEVIYGHTCAVAGMSTLFGNVQSQIQYSKTFSRTPVLTLGSLAAETALLDEVQHQMVVQATGLNEMMRYTGIGIGTTNPLPNPVTVNLTNVDGDTNFYLKSLDMTAGARVNTQSYAMAGGDTLVTTTTFTQALV